MTTLPSMPPLAGPYTAPHREGARAMTDSPTRVAEQRWHHGVPGAVVALTAAAATLLPGLAAAQDVYLRARDRPDPPGRDPLHRCGLCEPGPRD